jgi:hypothetical protein
VGELVGLQEPRHSHSAAVASRRSVSLLLLLLLCILPQAMLCNRTTSADACSALSFCRRSSSGLCTPRLYAQDNFGSSVQEYMVS